MPTGDGSSGASGSGAATTLPGAPETSTEPEATSGVDALLDPRYDDEIHPGPCPEVTGQADMATLLAKLSDQDPTATYQELSTRMGPLHILVGVAGGADYTRVGDVTCPSDSGRSCPERDAALAATEQIAIESQRCVRAFVADEGGEVTESFSLGNGLAATLTWTQLLRVAAHPHVSSLGDGDATAPPP